MATTHAVVVTNSPLVVRLDGAASNTTCDQKASTVPALSANDEVLVDIINGRVIVLLKLVAA